MKFLLLLSLLFVQSAFALAPANSDRLGEFIEDVLHGLKTHGRVDCNETVQSSSINDIHGNPLEVSAITEEHALRLFRELANDPNIPFGYPDDGCYARAHYMSRQLEERGIITDKVFVEGDLRVETANSPEGHVTWWYHVAPVVMVQRNGREVLMVFDPSIFDRPVPVDEWVAIQTRHDGGRVDRVYNTRRFVYQPDSESTVQSWQPADIEDMNSTMAEYLPIARERARARDAAAASRKPARRN